MLSRLRIDRYPRPTIKYFVQLRLLDLALLLEFHALRGGVEWLLLEAVYITLL